MKVFYVSYVCDPEVATCLDGIRLLCNPHEKARAHVTLRGPYVRRVHLDHLDNDVAGSPAVVSGVGTFFEGRQSTVFFRCDSPGFRKAWRKKNYPGYNPHITLYDGKSREFAAALERQLAALHVSFSFHPTTLQPLLSSRGQRDGELLMELDYAFLSRVAGRKLSAERLKALNDDARLACAVRVCQWLVSSTRQLAIRVSDGKARGRAPLRAARN